MPMTSFELIAPLMASIVLPLALMAVVGWLSDLM
jgi:hypothetical protein